MAGFNLFPEIAAGIKPKCQAAINKTVDTIKAVAYVNAAVDTGFMRENVYTVHTDGSSTYGSGSRTAPGDSFLLEEVKPDNDMQGIAGAAANYSIYVDYGTYKMGAQPFFTPAVMSAGTVLEAGLSLVFETV